MEQPKCDLCHDPSAGQPEEVYLHARCHLSAPLWALLGNGILTLKCCVPKCGRQVAQFKVIEHVP